MPTVTYNYVSFSSGPHQRQPTRTGSGGFTILQSNSGGDPASGTFAAPSPPKTIVVGAPPNQATFEFSFMTVSGGSQTQGGPPIGLSSFDSANPPPPVFIGNTPIDVLVVYVPTGGGVGGGGSGATIDEFDETTGHLINDTFVTVAPDPGGALTNSANVDGFVATSSASEAITALPTTSPTGVDFVGWVNLSPPAHLDPSPTLSVGQGQSVQALAFYQAPPVNLNLGTITGTVKEDSIGGMFELAGALISAVPGGNTRTGDDGTYVLRNLRPGPVKLTASAISAAAPETDTVTVIAGQTVIQDFILVRKGTTS